MKATSTSMTRGFTLIELLVVIATISLIASIVFAALGTARVSAKNTQITAQKDQYQKAIAIVTADTQPLAWPGNDPYYCVGSATCKFAGQPVSASTALNTQLNQVIPQTPSAPPEITVGPFAYSGIVMTCIEGSASTGCSKGIVYWPQQSTKCINGAIEVASGNAVLCRQNAGSTQTDYEEPATFGLTSVRALDNTPVFWQHTTRITYTNNGDSAYLQANSGPGESITVSGNGSGIVENVVGAGPSSPFMPNVTQVRLCKTLSSECTEWVTVSP
jgi:prepilin-type N-terminal cleavage/methylation domain-containing protein